MLEGLTRSFTIAFTVRSGSNAICDLLARNGLGIPNEWFQTPPPINRGEDPLNAFVRLVTKYQAGGVFGSKMSHNHRAALDEFLRESIPGYSRLDDILPDHRWVQLVRKDKVLQAISFCLAEFSGCWANTEGEPQKAPDFDYDFFHILSRVMMIQGGELAWQLYFRQHGVIPHLIVYEDFFNDLHLELSKLINYLGGLPPGHVSLELKQKYKVQRDELSETLRERFVSDFERLGTSSFKDELGGSLEVWTRFFSEQQWRSRRSTAALVSKHDVLSNCA